MPLVAPWNRKKRAEQRAQRERIGHEQPGTVLRGLAMFFTLTGNIFSVFVLLPLALMIWFYFVRSAHPRRYRRAIADLPRWELRPQ